MLLVSGSTRTVGRLAGQYPDRLGHLLTPKNRNGMGALLSTGLRWAADNGCYHGLDKRRFLRMLGRIQGQPRLLWCVCPDKVADARATLRLWSIWHDEIEGRGLPVAYVLQDGQENLPLPRADCYFIGGSTAFKLSATAADLASEAKRRGAWLHMGRVNSHRRMVVAHALGCDSIDGSSASMFGDRYIPQFLSWLNRIEAQRTLFEEPAAEAKP